MDWQPAAFCPFHAAPRNQRRQRPADDLDNPDDLDYLERNATERKCFKAEVRHGCA
jgi:hypothetical protein